MVICVLPAVAKMIVKMILEHIKEPVENSIDRVGWFLIRVPLYRRHQDRATHCEVVCGI